MNECQTLIRAGSLITQNERREVITDAAIAINAGRIAAVAPWQDAPSWQAAEFLDLSDMLVMPGLINAHSHGAMTFLRGLADDQKLMDWLQGTVFPIEARLCAEIVHIGSLLGFAEMLATGATGAVDMYLFEEEVLRAADIAGLRCLGGEAVFGFPSAACEDYHAALEATAALAERYRDNERIGVAVNPHSVYTADPQILAACRDLALAADLPLHIHLAETTAETAQCLKASGQRPVALCESLGLMQTRMIAAHLVDVTDAEIATLVRAKVTGCHNPSSNMKLASGVAPVTRMLAGGMTVGLGTDGPASNNQLNMFAEMSRAALLQKVASGDPTALPAQTVLDMATLGGAAALGRSDLGRIMSGFQADLIALSLDEPNMRPLYNPVSQAVYAASGHEVRLAMVAGEILYHNGSFTRFDYDGLLAESRKLREFALS
ncbi:MAG: amidohydrolase [Desulfovibrio sp.]|nr:amidohydrolase [Desulfovibrio sp.]